MSPSPKSRISRISRKSRKFNFPISLGIFKCPMASPNVPKSKIPKMPNIPNIPKVSKIQFPNILRHISWKSWLNLNFPNYLANILKHFVILSTVQSCTVPNINILPNIRISSSSANWADMYMDNKPLKCYKPQTPPQRTRFSLDFDNKIAFKDPRPWPQFLKS